MEAKKFLAVDFSTSPSYLKFVFHGSNILDQLCDSIAEDVLGGGIGRGLDLEDEVMVQRVRHLVSSEQDLGILQQLPI